ncbi:MAG: thioredoxin-dependent thiol peroxidase [Magnetococcales bacterium]|nr:thioredoxin-dependent thiol peroxidase [Magnetococcales bacterium]MBF0438335.1 thioredoxin-dependent thiol peroxidase [Magnetococcales bacterium]
MGSLGELIPDLSAPNQHGQLHTLKSLLGSKGSIVYFYPKDNTPGCTLEANDFQTLSKEFQERGFTVIGISKDSVKSHAGFCSKHGLEFTLLSDQDGAICEAFGVWKEKTMCGKTSMGIVRSTFIVDNTGTIIAVYSNVKTKEHAATVLADLDRMSRAGTP